MRRIRLALAAVWALIFVSMAQTASAAGTSIPPDPYYSPIFITAFQTSSDELDAVELYTDEPIVNLNGWSVKALDTSGNTCEVNLSSYLTDGNYVVAGDDDFTSADTTGNVRTYGSCIVPSGLPIITLQLVKGGHVEETVGPILLSGFYTRKGVTKTYRTDSFVHDFSSTDRTTFYAGEWYDPLPEAPFRIVEVLPHARHCSPLAADTAGCFDYIKLYNPTGHNQALDGLRLRIGYEGQNVTTGNAVELSGPLAAGYGIIRTQASGDPLSVTDSGGWAWLEDSYGVKRYDATVISYPSASSSSKIGWAWSLDPADDKWQWTAQPTPYNAPNELVTPTETTTSTSTTDLVPCRSDQYRNPATNRCKLIASSASSLTPCKPGQYRNPDTNRCRSATAATSNLKPCDVGEERNPATNRCRSVLGASVPSADFKPQPTAESSPGNTWGWLAFAAVALFAVGYGVWEWRSELGRIVVFVRRKLRF